MDASIERLAIKLSNNSPLTKEAALILSKIEGQDLNTLKAWLNHAVREQDIKISQVKNKRF